MYKPHVYYAKPNWYERHVSPKGEGAVFTFQYGCVLLAAVVLGLLCYL